MARLVDDTGGGERRCPRLLTSDSDGEGNGGTVISVAHEAFLSA